jgi:ribosome-associated translation inhibitor RaiA
MKLTIRARHVELTPDLQERMERRLRFALGRFTSVIRSVDATFVDVNGPRGGADKLCLLRLRGATFRSIVIEHTGTDSLTTLSLAAERAERALVRALTRRRTAAAYTY